MLTASILPRNVMKLKNTLKFIKLNESGVRMIIVFFTVLLVGQILIKFSQTGSKNPMITSIGDESFQNIHTVKSGESLWQIAQQYFGNGFKWQDIAITNNLTDENSLIEGQQLIIPSTTSVQQVDGVNAPLPTASDINNPANTSSISTEAKTYTVQTGDTLWSIAESQFGSGYNWVDIKNANSLTNADVISEDQVLFIPNVNPKTSTIVEKTLQDDAIGGTNYTVVKGDNLWKISVRAYGDGYKWVEIAKESNLQHPGLIYPGQFLSIPR